MTNQSGWSFRRALETPQALPADVGSSGDTAASLAVEARRAAYKTPNGVLRLPQDGESLEAFLAAASVNIADLPEPLAAVAWKSLITKPQAIYPLKPSGMAEDLEARGILPASNTTMRQLVLGQAVALPPVGAGGTRHMLGLAVLTLQSPPKTSSPTIQAWLHAEWHETTRAAAVHVETFIRRTVQIKRTAAGVLLAPDVWTRWGSDPGWRTRVELAAESFGFEARVLSLSAELFGHTRDDLLGRTPGHLLVVQGDSSRGAVKGAGSIIANWTHATGNLRSPRFLGAISGLDPIESLREQFARMAGLSDSLHSLQFLDTGEQVKGEPRFPIRDIDECRVDESGRHYLHEVSANLWWTRDTARHGGTVFKTYVARDGELVFEADRNREGERIDGKFKGRVGRRVRFSDLHGCATAASHIQ